jgi:hypothetical protein
MGKKKFVIFVLLVFLTNLASALTEGVQKLVEFETQANAAAVRSTEPIQLPHVEIPLDFVGLDFADRLDPKIADSLIFTRNGQKYVRWILNPEDTKWGKNLLKYFSNKGIILNIKNYFIGYQTASRSYIAEDPRSGVQFSVKSSTNMTGGDWKDKKQPIGDASDARLMSDFLIEQNNKRPFENFIIMDEPAILKIDKIDQAVVIRDLGELKNPENKNYFLPGFSALHEDVGREIALKNGSDDPYAFWTENYIKVAGRALGELAARTGVQFDSPHSQNFLIELDHNFKPTGKLVLRDMSDLYLDSTFMKALGQEQNILKKFTQKENVHDYIDAGFGPLHGNSFPSWVGSLSWWRSKKRYSDWGTVFFNEFENTFEKVSGFKLATSKPKRGFNGLYFSSAYDLENKKGFENLYRMMRNEGFVNNYGGNMSCRFVLSGN